MDWWWWWWSLIIDFFFVWWLLSHSLSHTSRERKMADTILKSSFKHIGMMIDMMIGSFIINTWIGVSFFILNSPKMLFIHSFILKMKTDSNCSQQKKKIPYHHHLHLHINEKPIPNDQKHYWKKQEKKPFFSIKKKLNMKPLSPNYCFEKQNKTKKKSLCPIIFLMPIDYYYGFFLLACFFSWHPWFWTINKLWMMPSSIKMIMTMMNILLDMTFFSFPLIIIFFFIALPLTEICIDFFFFHQRMCH